MVSVTVGLERKERRRGRLRVMLQYPNASSFDAKGCFAVDEGRRRMEWGAEV